MAKAKYDENFKKSLVALYRRGKTKHSICQEFSVPNSTFGKWIKKFNNDDNIESNEILNILQAQELKKTTGAIRRRIIYLNRSN
nr:transposase [Listeria monocytogenes]